MIYVANFTGKNQFRGFKAKNNENWYRIRSTNGTNYGIDVLVKKLNVKKIDTDAFAPIEETNEFRILYPDKVSVAFDRKTLNAFILSAMKFDADVFIVSIPIGPKGHGDLLNHYINKGQLYSYNYDMENGVMNLIFSLRRLPEARMSETYTHPLDNDAVNYTGFTITWDKNAAAFTIDKTTRMVADGEKPPKDKKIHYKNNVLHPETKKISLRKYFPGRPSWTVILTKPSLEEEVREILANNYKMTDKRLNLIVADGGKELKEACDALVENHITAVTYYISGKKYSSTEVRQPAIRKSLLEDIRTNYFGNSFERISVITSDGISSHLDIN